jgi:demethylmenaquinone methyltransferase/2-methoxy-6-polyprenyl-1,4-benzoquinol methylase
MGYAQENIKPYDATAPKGEQVERMFDGIAHSYDRLNHLLSFGIDRGWRRKTIEAMLPLPHDEILDVATGTGDFALLACRRLQPRRLAATDISEGMMQVGREKVAQAGLDDVIRFQREDCQALSFADASFDAVTVAYGVRNFPDLDRGLREMWRVLRPGGHAVILELTAPRCFPMKQLFWVYSHAVMPLLGRLLSKDRSAYTYLPRTMEAFPQGEVMEGILRKAGFGDVTFKRYTFGLSTMYLARK